MPKSKPIKRTSRTKLSDAEILAKKSDQQFEIILNRYLYGQWPGEARRETPRDERADRLHVLRFFRKYASEEHPWPPEGLTSKIESEGGKLRMWVEVTDDGSFVEAALKRRNDLTYWREQLTRFNNSQRWEGEPFQNIIILAKSKKGGLCLQWLKTVDPEIADHISRERGNGLGYGQLAKEVNQQIETWLTGCANWKRGKQPWEPSGDLKSRALLKGIGFTFHNAKDICEQLLQDIEQGRDPFHQGRAKHCFPVSVRQIRALIDRLRQ